MTSSVNGSCSSLGNPPTEIGRPGQPDGQRERVHSLDSTSSFMKLHRLAKEVMRTNATSLTERTMDQAINTFAVHFKRSEGCEIDSNGRIAEPFSKSVFTQVMGLMMQRYGGGVGNIQSRVDTIAAKEAHRQIQWRN